MSRTIIAILGIGIALLFAVPAVGIAQTGMLSTPNEEATHSRTTPVADTQENSVVEKSAPMLTIEKDGYNMTVYPPIANRTDFYGGATIPVKFQLFDSKGSSVDNANATLWVNEMNATSSGRSNQGNMFRYDPTDMMYIYNLNTKPLPAGPGSPTSTITIMVEIGPTTITHDFVVSLD